MNHQATTSAAHRNALRPRLGSHEDPLGEIDALHRDVAEEGDDACGNNNRGISHGRFI